MALGCIGIDTVSGIERFAFDSLYLVDGLKTVPVLVGLLGFSELLSTVIKGKDAAEKTMLDQQSEHSGHADAQRGLESNYTRLSARHSYWLCCGRPARRWRHHRIRAGLWLSKAENQER